MQKTPASPPLCTATEAAQGGINAGRRQAMFGAVGLAAALGAAGLAQAAPASTDAKTAPARSNPRRIDVHHHYVPPKYRSALEAAGQGKPSGMPGIPQWNVDMGLGMMDRLGIASAVMSVVNGVHFGNDAAARELSRYVNEEGAKAVAAHPTRFGLFATLPLPDVGGSLREIEYAFDTLKADGVVLSSNYSGMYLGDARFRPVFDELNRRKATVFLHPFNPHCPCCTDPAALQSPGYPYPMLEFMFETTRTVFNMVLSGTLSERPDLKVIVPHAGATIPVLAERVSVVAGMLKLGKPQSPEQFRQALRGLYFDLAGWPEPVGLDALMAVADPAHILYGSDWPYTPEPFGAELAQQLDRSRRVPPALHRAFMRDNALALFPRFANA